MTTASDERMLRLLRTQLDEANERIKQLEAMLCPELQFPRAMQLTETEERYLRCLLGNVVTTKEIFLDRCYYDRDEPQQKIIDVIICKVRAKLKRYAAISGVALTIETVWGRGYSLTSESRSELRKLVSAETASRASRSDDMGVAAHV